MNRQTTVPLFAMCVLFAFCSSIENDHFDEATLKGRFVDKYLDFLQKLDGILTPEQTKLLEKSGYDQDLKKAQKKIDELAKTLTDDQKKKILPKFEELVNGMKSEERKLLQPQIDETLQELKSSHSSSITIYGSIAIVAALTVF